MSDDKPRPADEPADEPAADPVVARRGFRERLAILRRSDGGRTFGLAALIASALAGIIVGGLGFAAVHAVTDDGPPDRGDWTQRGPMGGHRDGDDWDDADSGSSS